MPSSSSLETLQRAIDEIEALEAIYGDDFTVVSTKELLKAQQQQPNDEAQYDIPTLELQLTLNVDMMGLPGKAAAIDGIQFHCRLPPGYPEEFPAAAYVSGRSFSRVLEERLSRRLQETAVSLIGTESVMALVQEVQFFVDEESQEGSSLDKGDAENEASCSPDESQGTSTLIDRGIKASSKIISPSLGRRWVWAHHIKDAGRCKSIVKEANEGNLGGFLKPGYPGIVVVEGQVADCDEFVQWIKGSKSRPGGFGRNWGHHVKGEIDELSVRQLPNEFTELRDGMKELGALCRECGLEDEFLEYVMQIK